MALVVTAVTYILAHRTIYSIDKELKLRQRALLLFPEYVLESSPQLHSMMLKFMSRSAPSKKTAVLTDITSAHSNDGASVSSQEHHDE